MTGSGGYGAGAVPAPHLPVLLAEVLEALEPARGKLILDGTFGAGGYTRALLEAGADVIAIDQDPDAIAGGKPLAQEFAPRLRLERGRFSEMEEIAGEMLDGIVLDVGVSSMQLDQAERGFSFRREGPLDMRMGQEGTSAADVVNKFKAGDLARIFGLLGEERHAGRIARAIEKGRAEKPFRTTGDLAELVERVIGHRPTDKIHPATRVFQGLRIFVNDELGELARALFAAERLLKPGGILAVVTFHSLEDRIVKRFLQARSGPQAQSRHLPEKAAAQPVFEKPMKPVSPGEAETAENPRARSAHLRAARRTAHPAGVQDFKLFGVPALFVTEQLGEKAR
ncbi:MULTISPECIES: 16S rRNA (cytosine(1402)-N(4))-methyltransferase RsmH [Chelativorans]|jgi:16S rRNA (cytosine1402-N4)-methyltransferase|uniref:Ribosomal RNA small subunit methyltransferase H n=1 Tax=Chelativorans sp. (strain BNC1) TaxID=266779 RepID=RSMH_CHESB|nr:MULTISPECIES: 16S rRNA (cytosine(1402)-N(4))-methyltransferase RsmH [Chelativorans]Q11GR7.1 RecName: Full=Ribosomal RNA small subunit methyltransferase H; AltName: Full=16S rRNA m(4)C1402 methyltransferase; AltName: Full=rRNA (cytosine-N(4)-)-methyltransferase RsmH [Chelativorans sp. BNC1]